MLFDPDKHGVEILAGHFDYHIANGLLRSVTQARDGFRDPSEACWRRDRSG